jgi:DNA polymerase-1
MWICEKDTWLVGTDMEGAHLRIFAHLINDEKFIEALVNGRKEDGTDPHTVNKRVLGDICVDRDRAKTFVFTYLNGGAAPKVSEIFNCSVKLAKEALDTFVRNYPGLAKLKDEDFPGWAERGYFQGIDGRLVMCDSAHLMMGAVLQNMESVLMKYANKIWRDELDRLGIRYKQVNWVHDEWVTEVSGDRDTAEIVGRVQSMAIKRVGEMFKLRCPMAGEYKVGKNWLEVH